MTQSRFYFSLLAMLACLAFSGRVFAQDGEADYWTLVANSIEILQQESVSDAELNELIGRWETLAEQTPAFEPQQIVEQLKSSDNEEAITTHLQMFESLQTTRGTWPEPADGTISVAEANQQLEAILAQERFQYDDSQYWLWQRYQEWIIAGEEWLSSWFNRGTENNSSRGMGTPANTDPAIGLIGIVAAVVLTLILFQLVRQVTVGFNQEGITVTNDDDYYEPLTIAEAMERADQTAESGDYRHSVRYLYLSTLLILEEKGVLKPDRSLTNQEYLEVMDKHPKKAAVLRDVVNIFDRVWYGKREIDQPTLRFYQTQIRELQEEEAEA